MTCAIYCRLSKEDERKTEESESIQNQKAMLLEYAVRQEWDIYDIYCDEDYSGADRNRPEFNRMLDEARDRKFQIILCKTQSRFTRDMELVEKYLHGLFPLWGIRFVAVVDNVDTEVKGNKKARQINGLVNEWYLEELSENVRAVFAQKRKQGQYIGSFAAYGYRKAPADHNRLLIDEPAAAVVREVFTLFLQGTGTQRIAQLLNERGIPNPTRYKAVQGLAYGNGSDHSDGLWSHTSVGRLLKNELYTGVMVQGMKRKASFKSKRLLDVPHENWIRVQGTHEPIIDRETFDTVQRLLQAHCRTAGTGKAHLLAGKARCMDCGSAMQRMTTAYEGEHRSYLICKRYANTRKAPECGKHTIRLEVLTEAVAERIRTHTAEWYHLTDVERFRGSSGRLQRVDSLQKELAGLRGREGKLSAALKVLYLDKVGGVIEQEEFLEMNRSLLEDKRSCQARITTIGQVLSGLLEENRDNGALEKRIRDLLRLEVVPRELVELLIDTVEVGERNPQTNGQEIRINWKV